MPDLTQSAMASSNRLTAPAGAKEGNYFNAAMILAHDSEVCLPSNLFILITQLMHDLNGALAELD
jgi:hypothetical protein